MNIRCWDELVEYGAMDVLQREYGALLRKSAEPDYNVSLEIDLEQVPAEGGKLSLRITGVGKFIDHIDAREAFIMSISLFKRNALAAPFELAFKSQRKLEMSSASQGELMQIHYRDEEAIYVQASPDRVTVIFSTIFREETDRIFGKVFLQVCIPFPTSNSLRY
jgi:actin related protein 2/3 complex subunit 2